MTKSAKRLTQVTWSTLLSLSPSVGVFLTFTALAVLNSLRKPHSVMLKGTKYFQATTIINKCIISKETVSPLSRYLTSWASVAAAFQLPRSLLGSRARRRTQWLRTPLRNSCDFTRVSTPW